MTNDDLSAHINCADCWCQPDVVQICPHCTGKGCVLCDNIGIVPKFTDSAGVDVMIVHKPIEMIMEVAGLV